MCDNKLLASALGALAKALELAEREDSNHSALDGAAGGPGFMDLADAHYDAARRRFGCLGMNVMSAQCYVLSGIYMMYRLQPVHASRDFTTASITYLLHRRRREADLTQRGIDVADIEYTPCEERIFWTCVLMERSVCSSYDEETLHNSLAD